MQLTTIKTITGTLVLKSGLHIGAGDTEMRHVDHAHAAGHTVGG